MKYSNLLRLSELVAFCLMWATIITIKRTKDLNYFSLCALCLFNIRVSQFVLNYWNKWTFPRHSNLLRCTCICSTQSVVKKISDGLYTPMWCDPVPFTHTHKHKTSYAKNVHAFEQSIANISTNNRGVTIHRYGSIYRYNVWRYDASMPCIKYRYLSYKKGPLQQTKGLFVEAHLKRAHAHTSEAHTHRQMHQLEH